MGDVSLPRVARYAPARLITAVVRLLRLAPPARKGGMLTFAAMRGKVGYAQATDLCKVGSIGGAGSARQALSRLSN